MYFRFNVQSLFSNCSMAAEMRKKCLKFSENIYCQAATIYVHAYVKYVSLHKSFCYGNITIVLLLRSYRLIVALRKIKCSQNEYLPEKRDFKHKFMLVLGTSNFQGETIGRIVLKQTLYCLYCSSLNFLPGGSSKIKFNYFQLFYMKAATAKCKI